MPFQHTRQNPRPAPPHLGHGSDQNAILRQINSVRPLGPKIKPVDLDCRSTWLTNSKTGNHDVSLLAILTQGRGDLRKSDQLSMTFGDTATAITSLAPCPAQRGPEIAVTISLEPVSGAEIDRPCTKQRQFRIFATDGNHLTIARNKNTWLRLEGNNGHTSRNGGQS